MEKRKTESGYVNVSSAELTAADLVSYHNRIGGLNRVCTVINELAESISPKKINKDLVEGMSTTTIQRLGIIFEKYVNRPDLGQKLLEVSESKKRKFYLQPFKAGGRRKGFDTDDKWKIIINTTIEIDE